MVCDHCCRLCAAAFDFAKRIYVDPVCCGCGGHDGFGLSHCAGYYARAGKGRVGLYHRAQLVRLANFCNHALLFLFSQLFSQQPLFGCDDHVYRLCLNVPGDVQSSPALSGEQRLCAAGYTVFPVHLLVL